MSDCHKGYAALTQYWRPDVNHLDCNHSKGFAAPGPRSEAAGLDRVSSNAVEGAHASLYKLIRPWLGGKVGTGSQSHIERVKDIGVMMLNWKWNGQDIMQQVFLWLR